MIAELKSQRRSDSFILTRLDSAYPNSKDGSEIYEKSSNLAHLSLPADSGTKSAPVVVLREINAQVYKGHRRILQHVNLDLMQLGVVDEHVAKDLIEL